MGQSTPYGNEHKEMHSGQEPVKKELVFKPSRCTMYIFVDLTLRNERLFSKYFP